jgi:hypothetical protein
MLRLMGLQTILATPSGFEDNDDSDNSGSEDDDDDDDDDDDFIILLLLLFLHYINIFLNYVSIYNHRGATYAFWWLGLKDIWTFERCYHQREAAHG